MLFFGVSLHESARTAAKSSTNSGKATKRLGQLAPNLAHMCKFIIYGNGYICQTNCPSRCKGTWFTSADSSGNGHRPNTSRPSISQGAFQGGLGCHKFKSLGKLSNGWTDWHQMWHTSADPSGNGYTPNKLPLETQGGHLGVFRGQTFKSLGKLYRLAPTSGTRRRIRLGMDIG